MHPLQCDSFHLLLIAQMRLDSFHNSLASVALLLVSLSACLEPLCLPLLCSYRMRRSSEADLWRRGMKLPDSPGLGNSFLLDRGKKVLGLPTNLHSLFFLPVEVCGEG